MGVNSRVFDLLGTYAKGRKGRMLVAGYPDFFADAETVRKHCGTDVFPADAMSDAIKHGHGAEFIDYARDPFSVFRALGFEMDVIDVFPERGVERQVDLNLECDLGSYDLVLDHGTIEHCFNIGVAALNLARAVKIGGLIVQHLPMNMFNHGFYNLNPTWFYDFYDSRNGFKILHAEAWVNDPPPHGQTLKVPWTRDFMGIPSGVLMTIVAERVGSKVGIPIQHRYRR